MAKAHGGPLDAVVMIGHHAKTPSPKGFCSHTFVWGMEVLLDGDSLSESQTYAQALGAEGIPILVAAGDRWLLEEMRDGELGSARLVTTSPACAPSSAVPAASSPRR
jgi:D-aminopeptidase